MTIRYPNGTTVNATLLSENEGGTRLAAWMLRLMLSEEAAAGEDLGAVETRLDAMGLPRDIQHNMRMPWGNLKRRTPRPVRPITSARPRTLGNPRNLLADFHQKLARVASA